MKIKTSISVFIAEDEQPARELLIDYLLLRPELKLEGMAQNGEEALEKLQMREYNLLFLDINLPILSGIEILEKLKKYPYLIFTTAYDKYAIKAFEMGAVDYLLKPFSKDRFNQAVDKAVQAIQDNRSNLQSPLDIGLSIKENENHYILSYDDIVYISSHARHTVIHTDDKCFEIANLLKDIESKLPDQNFIRIHKQFIVNLKYISHFQYMVGGQYEIYLKDEDETSLPVGRKYANLLKDKLKI